MVSVDFSIIDLENLEVVNISTELRKIWETKLTFTQSEEVKELVLTKLIDFTTKELEQLKTIVSLEKPEFLYVDVTIRWAYSYYLSELEVSCFLQGLKKVPPSCTIWGNSNPPKTFWQYEKEEVFRFRGI